MQRMTVRLLASITMVLFAAGAFAGDKDLTGTWELTVQTGAGPGNPTLVLEQEGNALTGTYRGQLGEAPVQGTVDNGKFDLTFNVSSPMGSLDVRYTGEMKDSSSIAGEITLGALGQGTFTGKRH
jgi:hypothetical protein